MSDSPEFRALLEKELGGDLSTVQIDRVVKFREEVLRENEMQNLTRLLSPRDFLEGHVLDVIHLEKSGLVSYPAMDLGAGMGVPGFLHALIYGKSEQKWISCDSEAMKTAFIEKMVDFFRVSNLNTASIRGETYLNTHSVSSIVSRAVGPVSRIYNWFKGCSTWNNLILLKGPKWEEEWAEFQKTGARNRLKIEGEYRYEVGSEKKQRRILRLKRV